MVASGLAMPLPAISGAVPWIGSYNPLPPSSSEADRWYARDLRIDVTHVAEDFSPSALLVDPLGLAEVDVAGQLAHDEHVKAGNQLGAQRRRRRELRVHHGGTQVGEQPELLAQA